jgi:N-Dimethylarginine dimethylaminohydrolase
MKNNRKIKILLKSLQQASSSEDTYLTPSDINLPVFVMSLPLHATFFPNNAWMEEIASTNPEKVEVDVERFVYEWFMVYQCLSMEGIVLTFPSVPKLQDLHYINSFVYLPHIKDKKVCIISRFRAEGRQLEEQVAYDFLTKCGYTCYQPPAGMYFEGEPELKYLREDMYLGSYGVRGTKEALEWIENNFNCKIFKIGLETPKLYHGDCLFLPITPYDVLVAVNYVDKSELKKLENYVNVIPVEDDGLLLNGIMNNFLLAILFMLVIIL